MIYNLYTHLEKDRQSSLTLVNVGTMRGRSGEVVETLTRRCIDLCE